MEPLGVEDPRQIGSYRLVALLGSGGMGAVYLGQSAGRTVAVKVVRPDLARDEAFRDRFRSEVRAARKVSGAFTSPVVDADPDAEVPWMATAFVAGVSLRQAVGAHGPLPEDALWTLTAGLAEALTEVHGAGLIHRDLKPANVLLALDGPHVIDFGISRAADGAGLTASGAVIGSAPYMSPEQAETQPLTPASDMFSLGSTIAFAARGSDLFGTGAAVAVLFRIATVEPDLGAVPAGLRPLVAACLAKDPAGRPTPREVIEAVEREGRPVPSSGWLPEAIKSDIIAVRTAMRALPEPPSPQEVPHPPPGEHLPGAAPRPSRRRLLLGVAGGALAAAGTGSAIWWSGGGARSGSGAKPGRGAMATGISRPSDADVREGKLAWKQTMPAACPQVLSANGRVVCVSLQYVWGLDDGGDTKWTLDAATHGLTVLALGTSPVTAVATVDGGHLYVGGAVVPKVEDATADNPLPQSGSAVVRIDMSSGKVERTIPFREPPSSGVGCFWGVRDDTAYLFAVPSASNLATYPVMALNLGSRTVSWSHVHDEIPVFAALPPSGSDHLLLGTPNELTALTAKGKVSWSKTVKVSTVGAAGPHFVVVDTSGRLTALDPATGKKTWTASDVLLGAGRNDGIATNSDGSILYVLRTDADGGYSLGALDSRTGKAKWRRPVPADDRNAELSGARLLYADGNLYRMGADCVVWAFDPANGTPRWKYTGMKGSNPADLAWAAGDGRLCISDPTAQTVAALHANGA
ncbi:PQQ-binding-like beta-propeller repeat protein [Streptomyces sp. NPDC051315]|uniref:serine/threonine-protein kinase n=1 Tax=Streptomyces sp. NPDC051315 TaxID=3365650 RepID=UPI0037BB8E10